MPFYRTEDGKGSMHINFGRKAGPLPCAAPRLDGDAPLLSGDGMGSSLGGVHKAHV